MVDNLEIKLAIARAIYNERVEKINMQQLLFERLGMTKRHESDFDYEAPVAGQTTTDQDAIANETPLVDAPGTLEGEPSPGPLDEVEAPPKEYMLVAFDLSVWQRHDVEGKLQSFGGHGIKEVDAALLPPDAIEPPPEEELPPEEEIIEEKTRDKQRAS